MTSFFEAPDAAELAALESAVDLLYRARFDPRGLVSLLQRFQKKSGKIPWDAATLRRMVEKTRESISLRSPLINPIVRSDRFLHVRKRIQKL